MMENDNINWRAMSDAALIAMIGGFIQETRLQQNKTQAEIALAAGINRSTLSQIENGNGGTLISLIQILRSLDQLHLLRQFQAESRISPIELAKLEQHKRKRAGSSKPEDDGPETDW